jgi:hypothetical protein
VQLLEISVKQLLRLGIVGKIGHTIVEWNRG